MAPSELTQIRRRKKKQMDLLATIMIIINVVYVTYLMMRVTSVAIQPRYRKSEKKLIRMKRMNMLINHSDRACKSQLRVDRRTFRVLCEMVRDIGGLKGSHNMSLEEIVALFLYTLAHHFKNRVVGHHFIRSGESVSRNFHRCLLAVLKLHEHILKKRTPITEECEDDRWKCFKV